MSSLKTVSEGLCCPLTNFVSFLVDLFGELIHNKRLCWVGQVTLGALVVATGYWFPRLNMISDTDTEKAMYACMYKIRWQTHIVAKCSA